MKEETDNEVDNKAHLEQLGLKQEIMSSQASANKGLNGVADKTRRLDVDKKNS